MGASELKGGSMPLPEDTIVRCLNCDLDFKYYKEARFFLTKSEVYCACAACAAPESPFRKKFSYELLLHVSAEFSWGKNQAQLDAAEQAYDEITSEICRRGLPLP